MLMNRVFFYRFRLVVFLLISISIVFLYQSIFSNREQIGEGDGNGASNPSGLLCSGKPCNVILIVMDTLGAKHMGLYGYERDTTPFIDEFFGKQGVVFANAWSTATWTVPSFVSIYTSQYASDITVEDLMNPRTVSFLDVLRDTGISLKAFTEVSIVPESEGPDIVCKNVLCKAVVGRFKPAEVERVVDALQFLDAAQWVYDKEQAFVSGDKPFLLLIHNFIVHIPYDPPEPYRLLFDAASPYQGSAYINTSRVSENFSQEEVERFRRQYDQEIRYVDDLLKDFFEQLPQDVLDSSVVILVGDHGEAFKEHGRLLHSGPPHEEQVHVPFLVHVPQLGSRVISRNVSLLDLGPTILDIFGLDSPGTFIGRSVVPLIRGEDIPDVLIRAESGFATMPTSWSWQFNDFDDTFFKLTDEERMGPVLDPTRVAARLEEWKLIKDFRRPDIKLELYNLNRDPKEQVNLILEWEALKKNDQQKILPLFEELGVAPPES